MGGAPLAVGGRQPFQCLGQTAGACFGELAFLTGRPRTASARAREDVVLLVLRASDFNILMHKLPPVAISTCKSLADWLYNTNGQIGYRFVKLASFPLQAEMVTHLPRKKIEYYRALPLHRDGNRVVVGMTDPTDLPTVDALRQEFPGCTIETVAIMESELDRFIKVSIPKIIASKDQWGD